MTGPVRAASGIRAGSNLDKKYHQSNLYTAKVRIKKDPRFHAGLLVNRSACKPGSVSAEADFYHLSAALPHVEGSIDLPVAAAFTGSRASHPPEVS